VTRGERAFVLLNKFPYASGHLLVAPYRHGVTRDRLADHGLPALPRRGEHRVLLQRSAADHAVGADALEVFHTRTVPASTCTTADGRDSRSASSVVVTIAC